MQAQRRCTTSFGLLAAVFLAIGAVVIVDRIPVIVVEFRPDRREETH